MPGKSLFDKHLENAKATRWYPVGGTKATTPKPGVVRRARTPKPEGWIRKEPKERLENGEMNPDYERWLSQSAGPLAIRSNHTKPLRNKVIPIKDKPRKEKPKPAMGGYDSDGRPHITMTNGMSHANGGFTTARQYMHKGQTVQAITEQMKEHYDSIKKNNPHQLIDRVKPGKTGPKPMSYSAFANSEYKRLSHHPQVGIERVMDLVHAQELHKVQQKHHKNLKAAKSKVKKDEKKYDEHGNFKFQSGGTIHKSDRSIPSAH